MWWYKVIEWFSNISDRNRLLIDFNKASKHAFVSNIVPVYLQAEISRGNRSYKHSMSNFFYSGFRLKTLSGRTMTISEIEAVGLVIHTNQELMRKLVTLGFDTLEICEPSGIKVKDWRLIEVMQIRNW